MFEFKDLKEYFSGKLFFFPAGKMSKCHACVPFHYMMCNV